MAVITRNLRRTAQSAVSVTGFTLTLPAYALNNPPLRPTANIGSNGDNTRARKPADQPQSYAAALQDAYARIEICQNPALAALAANIAKLAEH